MLNLFLVLVGIFALFCIVARLLHRYFVYVPDPTRVAPKDVGLSGVEEIVFKAADGTRLIAWYSPAQLGKPTLLYFTGNSGNTADRAGKIKAIASDGYGVFMLNYRRFGGSGGRPSEKRNTADAVSAYDYLRGLGVAPDDIVIYGESLGTAVATQLCPQRQPMALVLEAPFTSVVDVASPAAQIHHGGPVSHGGPHRSGRRAAIHHPWRQGFHHPSEPCASRVPCGR